MSAADAAIRRQALRPVPVAAVGVRLADGEWIGRPFDRWGARLVRHRMARAFHVNPERMATASRWFARWGVLAIIFGRHIPGFRVPLTVVAGTINFPYRKFVLSVAVSTSVWAGFYMLLGNVFGNPVIAFLSANTWIYAVGGAGLVIGVAYFGVRVVRIARSSDQPEASSG